MELTNLFPSYPILRWPTLTMSVLATLQPRVPAPSKRHFVFTTLSRSKEGTSLQRISFRFRSTDDSASLHTVSEHTLWLAFALSEKIRQHAGPPRKNMRDKNCFKKNKKRKNCMLLLPFRVHTFTEVDHPGSHGTLGVLLPTNTFRAFCEKDKINTSWSNRHNVVYNRHYSWRQGQSKHTGRFPPPSDE